VFTQVKTPQDIFFAPQRLIVPLFQRPYVWSLERQWEPLWSDIRRMADRLAEHGVAQSHFLGAVVLQQQSSEIGNLAVRTIIDGQQRLTTLQVLFDAVFGVLAQRGLTDLAQQLENLVKNQDAYISAPSDRFKVWPTNRDRPAFDEVMMTVAPDYAKLENTNSRLARAHEFFFQQTKLWLESDTDNRLAHSLVTVMSRHLQIVVIDLLPEEDAQEIFETLNARGTPLTAADLIKNFVFQRVQFADDDAEKAYHQYWEPFETPFWETELSVGRILYSRSSLFFSQWLVAMTGEEITEREVFSRFKRFATDGVGSVSDLLPRLAATAARYREIAEGSQQPTGILSLLEMFVYRLSTLNTETAKPVLIWLTDPFRAAIPAGQLEKALAALESWFVRRALVKGSTKQYNQLMAALVREVSNSSREWAGDVVEEFLAGLAGADRHWPDDDEVREYLVSQPVYRKLARPRMRMVLEAVEDHRRGFSAGKSRSFSEQPVVRDGSSIEHVMPQEWGKNWPGNEYWDDGTLRNDIIHRLGNLVLVTQALNSKISNGPWSEKRKGLSLYSTLLTTKEVVELHPNVWSEREIIDRTAATAEDILVIWQAPVGHQGLLEVGDRSGAAKVSVADLISAGLLVVGQTLFARVQAHAGHEGYVAEDGAIFVNGKRFDTPSSAAREVSKRKSEPGWWFWVTDLDTGHSLLDARQEYRDSMGVDNDDDDDD
jgi:hypothetical protein